MLLLSHLLPLDLVFGVDAAQRGEGQALVGEAPVKEDAALSASFSCPLLQRGLVSEERDVFLIEHAQLAYVLLAQACVAFGVAADVLHLVVREARDLADELARGEASRLALRIGGVEAQQEDCVLTLSQLLLLRKRLRH